MNTGQRKQLWPLYDAFQVPEIMEAPPVDFLTIDGSGDPNPLEEYRQAVDALCTDRAGEPKDDPAPSRAALN